MGKLRSGLLYSIALQFALLKPMPACMTMHTGTRHRAPTYTLLPACNNNPHSPPFPLHSTDEFGNYIGSDLDSDASDDSAAEGEAAPADDEMEQDPNPNALAMTSQIQADADEGAASNAIVLHEDKK